MIIAYVFPRDYPYTIYFILLYSLQNISLPIYHHAILTDMRNIYFRTHVELHKWMLSLMPKKTMLQNNYNVEKNRVVCYEKICKTINKN